MKSFGYCLWYLPIKKHKWYSLTTGFFPHISIKTDLTLNSAKHLYKYFNKNITTVTLEDKLNVSNEIGFNAAYFNVKNKEAYFWWPKDAHVSFAYQYKPFTDNQLKKIKKIVNKFNVAVFDRVKIVKCIGHYKDWEIIDYE